MFQWDQCLLYIFVVTFLHAQREGSSVEKDGCNMEGHIVLMHTIIWSRAFFLEVLVCDNTLWNEAVDGFDCTNTSQFIDYIFISYTSFFYSKIIRVFMEAIRRPQTVCTFIYGYFCWCLHCKWCFLCLFITIFYCS